MLVKSNDYRTWTFIQYLLEDYSQRELAEPKDRRHAVSGLETRIARVLQCNSSYGVFEEYLCRNLLWYLVPHNNTETNRASLGQDIPSWSWMAYSGGIEFVKVPFRGVSWIKLQFNHERNGVVPASLGEIVGCSARRCKNCTARLCEARHEVVEAGVKRGWVQYDFEGDKEPNAIECVVIGSETATDDGPDQYYILLVRPTGADDQYKRIRDHEYKRIGVGQVQSSCVARQRENILLV